MGEGEGGNRRRHTTLGQAKEVDEEEKEEGNATDRMMN